jgi:serine/threonine-protein kinase RsbW
MVGTAHVLLNLSSRAENVRVARQALAGFANAVGLAAADLNDVSTALTEACNNASLHAYAGTEGPVEVELLASGGSLLAAVRDHGVGLAASEVPIGLPRLGDGEVAGIGLPAIQGLASRVRLSERASGGTEVAMEFDTSEAGAGRLVGGPEYPGLGLDSTGLKRGRPVAERGRHERGCFERHPIAPARLADTIELDMAPLSTARAVLPRVLYAAGARAYFPIDRLADLRRLSACLLEAGECWTSSNRVQAGVRISRGCLELRLGPLRADDFTPLTQAVRELDPAIEALVPVPRVQCRERLLLRIHRTPI